MPSQRGRGRSVRDEAVGCETHRSRGPRVRIWTVALSVAVFGLTGFAAAVSVPSGSTFLLASAAAEADPVSADEVRLVVYAAGITPEHLAAAGVTPAEARAVGANARRHIKKDDKTLAAAFHETVAKRRSANQLRAQKKARTGDAAPGQLATAAAAAEAAKADLAARQQALRNAAFSMLDEGTRSRLGLLIEGRFDDILPIQYRLIPGCTEAGACELRDALAAKRTTERAGFDVPQDVLASHRGGGQPAGGPGRQGRARQAQECPGRA